MTDTKNTYKIFIKNIWQTWSKHSMQYVWEMQKNEYKILNIWMESVT